MTNKQINLISENRIENIDNNNEGNLLGSTVVIEWNSKERTNLEYQTENDLEKEFIKQLENQGYEYLTINNENDLIINLRNQIEKINNYKFSDNDWKKILNKLIGENSNIKTKTKFIQEDPRIEFNDENGEKRNIIILDKNNIHKNILQVINQYENIGTYKNRYDVTILVNGLPLIHIELKKRGIDIREAFNQIERYKNESFWAGSGLYEYIQIFVISNGTFTKYYSNTTRGKHINEINNKNNEINNKYTAKKTSHTFEFTSWWADSKNNNIYDLIDFSKTFFLKHTILNIITKYCVFTSDEDLLVMRPYQIVATEKIIEKIKISHNIKKYGTNNSGGYIWHTTGSGKTLTSFKTAQLVSKMNEIDKVLFVVDRKDLDYQTIKEYDRFEKGCANSNTNTDILQKQLESNSTNKKIIVTTIQKLSIFIKKNKNHSIYDKEIVLIFDECHRSQFGEMHKDIVKNFKKYYLFGFTGTPIFSINANGDSDKTKLIKTTQDIFGDKLHSYTIVSAIKDKNVLPFRVEYIKTFKEDEIKDKKVYDINREEVFLSQERVEKIVQYILENFNKKTKRNENYNFSRLINIKDIINSQKKKEYIEEFKQKQKLSGFNSILCVSSIEMAKKYYSEFKKQMNENNKLNIALIYSYAPNENIEENFALDSEDNESTDKLDLNSKNFLNDAINDYNDLFKTNYSISQGTFENYYKDVSLRMKNREIDLLIVVNMFLTGFDATTLNTLWVDKNLKYQGLLQAFSRTNRILNSIKTFGNIVCFRNLEDNVNNSISLYGNEEACGIVLLKKCISLYGNEKACGIVLLKKFEDYYNGYFNDNKEKIAGYVDLVNKLREKYAIPLDITSLKIEEKKDFIKTFNQLLKVTNILNVFDEFKTDKILLKSGEEQDYKSIYLEIKESILKKPENEKESILNDIIFEVELLKSVDIDIDYILFLVEKNKDKMNKEKEIILKDIEKKIDSSVELRSKKDLILEFINNINLNNDIYESWKTFINEKKEKELNNIIIEEKLNKEKTIKFIKKSFDIGYIKEIGTDIGNLFTAPIFVPKNSQVETKQQKQRRIIEKLKKFFERFKNIS